MSQRVFLGALLDASQPAPSNVQGINGTEARKRFNIYRNNVIVSLIEALAKGYPRTKQIMGDAAFAKIANAFVRKHPPNTPIMLEYGGAFPRYLKQHQGLKNYPYLHDLAKLELLLRRAYHGADSDTCTRTDLEAIAPECFFSARLTLAPTTSLLRSRWPVFDIWSDHEIRTKSGQAVFVSRQDYDPKAILLRPGDASFIQAIQDKHTVGEAFEYALSREAAFDFSALLPRLIDIQAITQIEMET